jgi:uncharacterized protein (TIGR02466 family)
MTIIQERDLLRLFPSIVFKGRITDDDLLSSTLSAVYRELTISARTDHRHGQSTHDRLHETAGFQAISQVILEETARALDFYSIVRTEHYITGMWSHVTRSEHRHPAHVHPNSLLSGVIYLAAPENSGNLIFLDPRAGSSMIHPEYQEPNYFNLTNFIHQPKKGNMLIWSSWLPHCVDQATRPLDQDRVVLAFNVMIKGSVNRITERIIF